MLLRMASHDSNEYQRENWDFCSRRKENIEKQFPEKNLRRSRKTIPEKLPTAKKNKKFDADR